MPTYLYETLPGEKEISRFEIKQSIHDAALTHHPETGEPIRRVISGGLGLITAKSSGRPKIPSVPQKRGGCGCGGCGCHH